MNRDENEPNEPKEPNPIRNSPRLPVSPTLTLDKAIELGEYKPEYLAGFPEWHTYTRQMQFELIKKALTNRRKQLLNQWAEINRSNDFRLKPHLIEASDNLHKQLEKVRLDKERLYAEYSMEESEI